MKKYSKCQHLLGSMDQPQEQFANNNIINYLEEMIQFCEFSCTWNLEDSLRF